MPGFTATPSKPARRAAPHPTFTARQGTRSRQDRRGNRPRKDGDNWAIAQLASAHLVAETGRKVRPAFMEPLVEAIAKRFRAGWSVARLSLWLRTTLRDPQTDEVCVVADRWFVAYITGLLAGAAVTGRASAAA